MTTPFFSLDARPPGRLTRLALLPGRHADTVPERWIISVALCSTTLLLALMTSNVLAHWFIVPIFACGVLCCVDGILLFQAGGEHLFDPVAFTGAFGTFFFFLAPLLHVGRDYWFTSRMSIATQALGDWRDWLGWMGILNLVSLFAYRVAHQWVWRRAARPRKRARYELDPFLLRHYGVVFLALTFALQVYLFARFGGVGAFVEAYGQTTTGQSSFEGLGWIMCIAESFPIVLIIVFVTFARRYLKRATTSELGAILTIVFALLIVFGGLRGSRGNVVYGVAYAVGIVHLQVRRFSWKFLVSSFGVLGLFMYFYAFYKVNPDTFRTVMESPDAASAIGERTGRTIETLVLGDLDRADIQAYMLFRLVRGGNAVEYALGRTYVDGILSFIPHSLSQYRPPGKLKYGTDLVFGENAYNPGIFVSTKIYGLAGETMLNFGVWAVPLAFLAFGAAVGSLRVLWRDYDIGDPRRLLLPIAAILCVVALSSDLDNVLYVFFRHALVPGALLWLASRKMRLAASRVVLNGSAARSSVWGRR